MPLREQTPTSRSGAPAPGQPSYGAGGYEPLPGGELLVEYPASPTAGRRVKKGTSPAGTFFLALLAQLFLIATVVGLAVAFPGETADLIAQARAQLALGSAPAGPALSASMIPNPNTGRLEILRLEDQAIFRRDRQAWDALEAKAVRLPTADPDYEAVHASLIRIRIAYERLETEVPPVLDPREIFPTAATEAEIPLASLIQVLRDTKQTESKRQRCAFLLQKENSPVARSALFQSIQEDPSLLVVRQSFQSFRSLTGYPDSNCFDAQGVARWWSRNAHTALGQN